jgi:hypothetical protein
MPSFADMAITAIGRCNIITRPPVRRAVPPGKMGDRAAVIFATPEEINKVVEARC